MDYRTPDLYFEKQTTGLPVRNRRLEKARIDVTAFLGFAVRGPVNRPVRITSWKSFESIFGGHTNDYYLPQAVFGFFANGGREAVIIRVARASGDSAAQAARVVMKDLYGRNTLKVTAREPGQWGNKVKVRLSAASKPPRTQLKSTLAKGATEAHVDLIRGFEPGAVVRISEGPRQEYVRLERVERKKLVWSAREALRGEYTDLSQATIEAVEVQLTVQSPFGFEIHDNLVFDPRHPRALVKVVNERSTTVRIEDLGSRTPSPFNIPQADVDEALAGGADGVGESTPADFIGRDDGLGNRSGLLALEDQEDVGLICVPDLQAGLEKGEFKNDGDVEAVQQAVVDFCERHKTAVALLDVPRGYDVDQALDWRARFDSKYAALFYPWLRVQDTVGRPGATRLVPPCGHVAGLTSQVDQEQGVHRAAANLVLNHVIGLERELTKDQTDVLAPEGVNCFRAFRGRGIRPWGARTVSSNTSWQHLSVRRLFIMVERSIAEGCEWAVFETNGWDLWKAVERQISTFLYQCWREGMLVGQVPEQAFYVRCDEQLNPADVREAGEFHCEIGLAAVRPAEFLVFRIGQQAKDIITEEPVS
ncbi:MAG: phage tail sheath family protein [Planctomycetes bacterium]|nr:phage tail sheath family protein [Planctomycetota bacterium]